MTQPQIARSLAVTAALLLAAACGHDSTGLKKPGPATRLVLASGDSVAATVGASLATPIVVTVTDANGTAVPAATVAFAVSVGNGSVTPRSATTDAGGHAQTVLTLGTIAGQNQVTVTATGVTGALTFTVTGMPGPAASLNLVTKLLRIQSGVDTARLTALVADQFGNGTTPGAAWTVRDPSLLSVDSTGFVHVISRGKAAYVVATAGPRTDSAYVVVLAPGQSQCTDVASPTSLAVGQVFTAISGGEVCIHADVAGARYELVPYYNSSVPSNTIQIEAVGFGLDTAGAVAASASRSPSRSPSRVMAPKSGGYVRNDAFDGMLRQRERALEPMAAGARHWYAGGRAASTTMTQGKTPYGAPLLDGIPATTPQVGDLMTLNASLDACTTPAPRVGRVAAITQKAIVVADTGNPVNGFTDTEYQSIGATFDTLVYNLDVGAFGAPSDIDNNQRIVMFFTRAVNDLTPDNSSSVILGFFYGRDLLPKAGTNPCPTSNQGEMFYLMVPDSARAVKTNSAIWTKTFVSTNTIGTTAHEFQHLINASRRLYVNHTVSTSEEAWLNEGLSHVAEELLFYRVAGIGPRQNIDSAMLVNPTVRAAFFNYENNNARRYGTYLAATRNYAPVGATIFDDALQTRGAIWSFLRYAADRRGATDGTFWYQLVNSPTTGIDNLTQVLGTDPGPWMHDWAISNYTDDWVPSVAPQYTQPSWNTRSYFAGAGYFFPLTDAALTVLADGTSKVLVLRGGGVTFMRFTVPAGQDALLSVTANSQPLPSSVQLAIVRVK